MPVVYNPTTPVPLYKNNFAPITPGSPASALPFAFKSATTLPLIEPKQDVAPAPSVSVTNEAIDTGVGVVGEIVSDEVIPCVALVVLNAHAGQASSPVFNGTPMVVSQPEGTALVDVLTGQGYTVGPGGGLAITLPPLTGAVLVPQGQL